MTIIRQNYFLLTVPLTPSGFNISGLFDAILNTTVRFEWDPPQGRGPEAVVDFYQISIVPKPLSHAITSVAYSILWNATIAYNMEYTVSITAVNCAGESNPFVLSGLEFSKNLMSTCSLVNIMKLSLTYC